MEIAEKIKAARESLQLTQQQAANKWGISRRTLENWEQGRNAPRGLALKQLEAILDAALKQKVARRKAHR